MQFATTQCRRPVMSAGNGVWGAGELGNDGDQKRRTENVENVNVQLRPPSRCQSERRSGSTDCPAAQSHRSPPALCTARKRQSRPCPKPQESANFKPSEISPIKTTDAPSFATIKQSLKFYPVWFVGGVIATKARSGSANVLTAGSVEGFVVFWRLRPSSLPSVFSEHCRQSRCLGL